MIPPFDDSGYLPGGVHAATLDEISERIGAESELRRVEMESIRWLLDLARRAGVLQVIIDGSFVTDAYEPNDVDCVLLIGEDYPRDAEADAKLQQELPFVQATLATQEVFEYYVNVLFGTDRRGAPKGLIEVML